MNQITELTELQEKRMDEMAEKAIANALSGDTSFDSKLIEKTIDFLYEEEKNKKPEIVICQSPSDIGLFLEENNVSVKDMRLVDGIGIGYDSGWITFYKFMREIGVDYEGIPFDEIAQMLDSGIWDMLLFENLALVCIRPSVVKLDKSNNLNCVDGKAIGWVDGSGMYFLNGVFMEEWMVMTPAEKIDVNKVLGVVNVEQRRELVRKIGAERFIQKLGARVVDKQGNYELLQLLKSPYENFPEPKFLKMKNASLAGVWHVEAVHPDSKTVQEAINFRANLPLNDKKGWHPDILT